MKSILNPVTTPKRAAALLALALALASPLALTGCGGSGGSSSGGSTGGGGTSSGASLTPLLGTYVGTYSVPGQSGTLTGAVTMTVSSQAHFSDSFGSVSGTWDEPGRGGVGQLNGEIHGIGVVGNPRAFHLQGTVRFPGGSSLEISPEMVEDTPGHLTGTTTAVSGSVYTLSVTKQ